MENTTATTNELYRSAERADKAFQSALMKAYGKEAGDIRYYPARQTPEIRVLGDAYRAATELWREAVRKESRVIR